MCWFGMELNSVNWIGRSPRLKELALNEYRSYRYRRVEPARTRVETGLAPPQPAQKSSCRFQIPVSGNMHVSENPPKIIVANQARFARRSLLERRVFDRSKHRPPLLGRDRNPEFLALQVDAVQPAFLAENDPALRLHNFRRVRLDRLRKMKLAGHRAAFAHEQILADQRLPRLKRVP